MSAYYNEIDPGAAAWLRELIADGLIAPGDVDERSIEDVRPDELAGYTQCHFFAGIGGWSLALRLAGWPDDKPIWTGSCPCQPFSAAGKGDGFADERHLWPAFHWLIQQCGPPVVAGEQVASKAAGPWLDLVSADLEALGYAVGAVAFPAAGLGAPHIRDRCYWVGHSLGEGLEGHGRDGDGATGRAQQIGPVAEAGRVGGLADRHGGKQQGQPVVRGVERDRQDARRAEGIGEPESHGDICGLADARGGGIRDGGCRETASPPGKIPGEVRQQWVRTDSPSTRGTGAEGEPETGPTNGFWADADWLLCRDGKWRPVEPGSFPLVDGLPRGVVPSSYQGMAIDAKRSAEGRVMRLRGYGNAIVPQQAAEFVRAFAGGDA